MSEQTTEAQTTELPDVPFEVPEGWRLVSDDEAEALARQLVEDHRENWEIQEIVDAAVEACEMNDMLRNEFYYEYKQGGREVRGLTASMIAHLATARGISEVIEHRKHVETDEKHEFEVVVSMPDPFNPDNQLFRTGFCEEPKVAYNKYDKFAKQKAYTKAFRNGCMKLLPQDLIIAAIYKLAKLVPVDFQPPVTRASPKALPAPQNGQPPMAIEKAMRACFDAFGEKEQDLADLGVSKADFWDALGKVLNVKSRDDMTVAQWTAVEKSLKTVDFGKIVRDVFVECGVDLADLETPESDIPF